ncbi:MAG: DUF1302 family protein [Pseudomonadota bacterium]
MRRPGTGRLWPLFALIIFSFSLAGCATRPTFEGWPGASSQVTVGGVAEADLAHRVPDGGVQKLNLELRPELEVRMGEADLVVKPRLRIDPIDDIAPGKPEQPGRDPWTRSYKPGNDTEIDLHEAFVRLPVGPAFLTLGKQQTVWGEADGLKVLDTVNPQDFREFILDEFDQSRIPQWSVKAETAWRGIDLEAVWLLDQSQHDLAEPGADYFLRAPRFLPPVSFSDNPVLRPVNRPGDGLQRTSGGLRARGFHGGIDWSVLYLYQYDPAPVYRLRAQGPVTEITPSFRRRHIAGATFAAAQGPFTLRGEAGYVFGQSLSVPLEVSADGLIREDRAQGVLGLDWQGPGQVLVSGQAFVDHITGSPRGLRRPDTDRFLTLLVRKPFLNETLSLDARYLTDAREGDGLARLKAVYQLSDDREIGGGLDAFFGDQEGVFGQFNDQSRVNLLFRQYF